MYEQEQENDEFVEPSRARRIRERERTHARRARVSKRKRVLAIKPTKRTNVKWWDNEEVA